MRTYEKLKILVVDDKPESLLVFKAALEDLSAEIVEADSGDKALNILLENSFSLIILDVRMPGMDGFEVAELIRGVDHYKHIPIIFVTGLSRERTQVFKGYDLGAVDYIFKPIDPDIVKAKVKVFLELDRQRKALEKEITLRRKVENELRTLADGLKEANKSLEEFSYVVSHDLKTPLISILGFAGLLKKLHGDSLDEQGLKFLNHICSSADQMEKLIDTLLEYAQTTASSRNFTIIDLEDIVNGVLKTFSAALVDVGGEVSVGCLPTINADKTQIHQLFQNLIGNSIKYRRPETPLKINVYSEKKGNGFWKIIVEDNGIGFSQADANYIFAPFHRLNTAIEQEGSGIGLSICRKVCQSHGGSIIAQGVPGKGAKFIINLREEPPVQ